MASHRVDHQKTLQFHQYSLSGSFNKIEVNPHQLEIFYSSWNSWDQNSSMLEFPYANSMVNIEQGFNSGLTKCVYR